MQKLAEICVRRPVFATMLILSLTVVGAFSFLSLGVDLFPKVDFPTITVTVVNPGASPREIETEVTDKVEAAVNTISGIDELRSTSVEGVSQVFITFLLEKNADVAAQEVRDKVNLILGDLPETAEQPIIQKLDTDAAPVLRIAVSANKPLRDVTYIADNDIKKRIESINGVGNVEIVGGATREIHVWVDPDKMRAYNVTVPAATAAVRAQNLEVPGGRVDEGTRELTVRTMGRITNPADFNNITIQQNGGYPVKVSDIGYAADESEEQRTAARLNGLPAVTLVVSKQSGQNTVLVADAVKERLKELQPALEKKGVRTQIVGDQSIFIKAAVESIETHLVEGGLLAALVVFLFLWNIRSTIIAAIAIPTSIIATFGLMAAMGYTLNQITMLALTLMVGIVIDDAIVVLENIYRFVEEKGYAPFQAAIEGTREIGLAVMATTLSLLAVFLPVGFMGGIVGRFMSSFGLTSAAAIAVSLIVSFTLTPMLAARWIKAKKEEPLPAGPAAVAATAEGTGPEGEKPEEHAGEAREHSSKESRFYRPIDRTYTWMLKWSMAHRWMVALLSLLVILSIYPMYQLAGINFLPDEDESSFQVTLRAPQGTSLAATQSILDHLARDIREQVPGVEATQAIAGFGGQASPNTGSMTVRLVPPDKRSLSQAEIIQRTRAITRRYPKDLFIGASAISSISSAIGGGRSGSLAFYISGPDLDKLDQYSQAILNRVKQNPNVQDADRSLVLGNPEARVVIDRQRAADLGVKAGDIAQALSTMVAGQRVSTYSEGSDQYDVVLMAENRYRQNTDLLSQLTVPSSNGGTVELSKVVRLEEGTSPTSIDRINRQRQVTITASVSPTGSETEALKAIQDAAVSIGMDAGYTMGVTGQSKQLGQANYYFMLAFLLSFIFMYLVLAAQFESFIHPVTILLTLPLAIPFALLSTFVAGQKLNIFSALGILVLFGIVKKNAILQIDHTNELRRHGMERYGAIIQANRDRLRPILMTTIALVAGMIPLVISTGPGAGTNHSIGVLVVGGQSLCLLLTLLAVPVFYSLFEDAKESGVWSRVGAAFRHFRGRLGRRAAEASAPLSRRPKPTGGTLSRQKQKDRYADQASGD